ncbi:hypothetical protein IWQ61_007880 [Dispira simplex]|nr:hypothetical protein IWQ61_007880 [Dispira simplex]
MYPVEYNIVVLILSGFSVLSGLVTIGLVLWVWRKCPSSKESPSFNLSLCIALSDLVLRVPDILTNELIFGGNFPRSASYARFLLWIVNFSSYWFIYLTIMVTLDLQLVFFYRLPRSAPVRRWYPLIGTAFAFVISYWYPFVTPIHMQSTSVIIVGTPLSTLQTFYYVWNYLWLHMGVIYTLGVVVAVYVKVYLSQRQVGRFMKNFGDMRPYMGLFQNTQLIMAYPAVFLIVYVPYIISSWLVSYAEYSAFTYYWCAVTNISFILQGVFSLLIFLFHPVMLSMYRTNNIDLDVPWSRVARLFHATESYTSSVPDTVRSTYQESITSVIEVNKGVSTLHSDIYLKNLNLGPNTTGLFNEREAGSGANDFTSQYLKGTSGLKTLTSTGMDLETHIFLDEYDKPNSL